MTVDVNHPAPRDRARALYFGLIASLAVNLLFVGGFAAAAWHLHFEKDKPRPPGLLSFVAQLPPDRQEPVQKEIVAARDSLKDLRATMRQSWLDANAMLTSEPFDKAKFAAALMQLKDMEARYRAGIYNMVADTAGILTPDERKLLQKWRADRRAHFLRRMGKDEPDDKKASEKPLTN